VGAPGTVAGVTGADALANTPTQPPPAGLFTGTTPTRILDTRSNQGLSGPFGPQQSRYLTVGGVGPVPADANAVVINVTATGPSAGGWLTLFPNGQALPTASNLNFTAGETVPNLVVVKLGTGHQVTINNTGGNAGAGTVNVIADVVLPTIQSWPSRLVRRVFQSGWFGCGVDADRVVEQCQDGVEGLFGDRGWVDEAIDAEAAEEGEGDLGELRGRVFRGPTNGREFMLDQCLYELAAPTGRGRQLGLSLWISSRVEHELEVEGVPGVIPEHDVHALDQVPDPGELLDLYMRSRSQDVGDDGELTVDPLVEELEEEVVFALEVRVDGSFRESRRRRDLIQGRAVEPVPGEDDRRGVQEMLAGHRSPPLGGQGLEAHSESPLAS
jgi:hypothetical protein